jgi:hypothetical protein
MGALTQHLNNQFSLPIPNILCQTFRMRKLTATLCLTIAVLFAWGNDDLLAGNIYEQLTGGRCQTAACMNRETIKELTDGRCQTTACYCSLYPCPRGGGYDYSVSGYGNGEYVSGSIDASSGSRDVDGYITLEDGREVSFEGEWVGKGEIEGYDEDGNYYELEVD